MPLIKDGLSSIESVAIDPCSNEPCTLRKGSLSHFSFQGMAPAAADSVRIEAEAYLGEWVQFVNETICGSGIKCPVYKGQALNVEFEHPTDNNLPSTQVSTRPSNIFEVFGILLECNDCL